MIFLPSSFAGNRRLPRGVAVMLLVCAAAAFSAGSLRATPIPQNLGNGLDKLVISKLTVKNAKNSGAALPGAVQLNGATYTDAQTAALAGRSIMDAQGRVMVRVTCNGRNSFQDTHKAVKAAVASATITAKDKNYRGVGVMDVMVDIADVPALAQVPGVAAVILELKPTHSKISLKQALASPGTSVMIGDTLNKLGTCFDQGVTQHRVDQINKFYNPSATLDWEGAGMQVACISNSFASNTTNSPAIDVANYDLPGSSTDPVGNTTPVYILQDDTTPGGDDEGRAMCQIVHKMAPKAAIAFGTADEGEVGFANNIRGLAGLAGFTNDGQTFAADTICDDVSYDDEPYFQDGIIADGVDDASAAGVCYFSSAANDIGTNGYDSALRFVANGTGLTAAGGNTALTGTNINLANVPTNLYAGGFHNFNPAAGQLDVAETVNVAAAGVVPTVLQWNEPYDQTAGPTLIQPPIYTATGTYTNTDLTYTITPSLTAGTIYELDENATNNSGFDGAITIKDPSGNVVVPRQDTSADEVVRFSAPVTGAGYTIIVGHFATTMGTFKLTLYTTTGSQSTSLVKTQISLLVFDMEGNYIPASSLTSNAFATDEPLQLGFTDPASGEKQVQYVIARANVPTGPDVATEVRYELPGNGRSGYGPAEYFSYNTVTTGGHNSASTCNGCAAVDVFRPNLPEGFTSPGPVTIYYDKNDNRLNPPEIRLEPHIATADNGNVSTNMSYFTSDVPGDPDTDPNFAGTSAAGPHAAAIAALVLQAKGGRRSITPAQMTSLLERSTFPHDLDPNSASGSAHVTGGGSGAGKVTITINSDDSSPSTSGLTGTGGNDKNAFTIGYIGGSSVTSFVFNPTGSPTTGGNVNGGNNGVTYSTGGVGGTVTYFENVLPGVCFLPGTKAFTLGTGVTGATAAYSNSSNGGNQYYTMTITVPPGNMTGGNILHFTVARGVARASSTGSTYSMVTSATLGAPLYTADIFGGGVRLPDGTVTPTGMSFSGTTADGGTFSGTIRNYLGTGYSVQDGFGFVNAQTAVGQSVQ